jgi:hypothetical protein
MAARKVEQAEGYGVAVDAMLNAIDEHALTEDADHRPQTDADWIPLALAALDQGGVSVVDQARVRKIVEPYMRTSSVQRLSSVRFTVLHTESEHIGATFDTLVDAERYVPTSPCIGLPNVILASDGRAWLRHPAWLDDAAFAGRWYMVEPSYLPHQFKHVQGRAIVSQFVAEHA